MSSMGRVLAARRLSHGTDAGSSVARQGATISDCSRAFGHDVVHLTDDTDISGATQDWRDTAREYDTGRDDYDPEVYEPWEIA
jgi:hypothetical protein